MKKNFFSGVFLIISTFAFLGCVHRPRVSITTIPPLVIPNNIQNFKAQDYYPIPAPPPETPPVTTVVPPGSILWDNPKLRVKHPATY